MFVKQDRFQAMLLYLRVWWLGLSGCVVFIEDGGANQKHHLDEP